RVRTGGLALRARTSMDRTAGGSRGPGGGGADVRARAALAGGGARSPSNRPGRGLARRGRAVVPPGTDGGGVFLARCAVRDARRRRDGRDPIGGRRVPCAVDVACPCTASRRGRGFGSRPRRRPDVLG